MSTEFDWSDAEDVVVPEQAAIAVYLNPKGDVMIRQAAQYHPDEDRCVVFGPQHASRLADAILEAAGLGVYQPDDSTAAAPKDRTAAERQRRYRERNRHASRRDASDSNGTMPLLLNNGGGHRAHAPCRDGERQSVVTFDDFEVFGVTRRAIKPAIQVAVRLGFIDVTFQGVRSHGSARRPSRYAITWLPRSDGTLATNRWKSISTKEQAEAAVAAVYLLKKNSSRSGTRRGSSLTPTQDIRSSVPNATGAKSSKSVIPR